MRYVAASILFSICCTLGGLAGPNDTSPPLTILFRFDGPHSQKSVDEMKRELGAIMKGSGVQIDWRERSETTDSQSFANLVVVTFKGKCVMEPVPYLYDERGPLAFTNSSDGAVLPFSEIACDKVRSSLRGAMWGGEYARADQLFGRALARVLAHELYHVLAGTSSHVESGVARRALSGADIISDRLRLSQAQLDRMHSSTVH